MAKPPLIVFYYDCTAPIKKVECAVKQENPGLPILVTREKIFKLNGTTFDFEDKKIPLNLYASISKYDEKTFNYKTLFTNLVNSIRKG